VSLVWIGSLVAGAIGVILMAIPILSGKRLKAACYLLLARLLLP
jgi:hypothetical protein